MSWNYTPHSTDATTVDRDKIRFQIGDTDSDDPLLQDEEVLFALDSVADGATVTPTIIKNTSIMCLKSLASRYSRLGSYKVGKVSVDGKAVAKAFSDRVDDLSSSAEAEEFAVPSFGGFKSGEDIDGTTAWDDWTG